MTRPVEDLVADDFLVVLLVARGGRLRRRDEAFLPVELAALVASERILRAGVGEPAGEDPLRGEGFRAGGAGAFTYAPLEAGPMIARGVARGRLVTSRERVPPFRRRTLPARADLEALRERTLRDLACGPERSPLAHLLARAASRWSVVDVLAGPQRSARELVERAAATAPPAAVIPLIRAAWDQMREVRREGIVADTPRGG